MAQLSYPFYIIFGILPSLGWLLFYLRKDVHPESNSMVLKIFLWGMLATLPIIAANLLLVAFGITEDDISRLISLSIVIQIFWVLGMAFVEEVLKYLVVSGKVLKSSELDEPIDLMLYMIISALGFAAVENVLILFGLGPEFLLGKTISTSLIRFWGATFLHALCSGLVGYFLALAIFETKKRLKLISLGLLIATFLHGLFNFAMINIGKSIEEINERLFIFSFIVVLFILIGLAIFLTLGFKKLKKIKSVCKI